MSAMVLQIGYVGSKGTHIYSLLDVNMPPPGSGSNPPPGETSGALEQAARPFFSQFPQFGQIGTISSINNSSYNSLQIQLKTKNYHGLTTQFAYTWAHAIDEASETMDFFGTSGFVPKDSRNPRPIEATPNLTCRKRSPPLLHLPTPGVPAQGRRDGVPGEPVAVVGRCLLARFHVAAGSDV